MLLPPTLHLLFSRINYKNCIAGFLMLMVSLYPTNFTNAKNYSDQVTEEVALPLSKIPKSVLKAFATRFPFVKADFWVMVELNYQVQFEQNGRVKTAEFDKKGKWINSETIVELQDIPSACTNYILANYKGYEYNIAIFEEIPNGKFYCIGVATESDYQELIFDKEGNFLRLGDYVD